MGVVYRARHLTLDRETALKLISPALSEQEGLRNRFRREARAAALINHPNVVSVHNAGEEEGRLYLSMQYVDGPDLADVIAHEGALEPELVAELIEEVAAGLDAAHERGLVHRDVKPSNVLLERDGPARVSDFGISQIADAEAALTGTADFLGSPDYLAPEQVEGTEIDRRADVYALGGVAHFLLTGEVPFPNRSAPAKLVAHAAAERPRPSDSYEDITAEIDEVIATAMAADPEQRYGSAGELAEALGRAVAQRAAALAEEPDEEPDEAAGAGEPPEPRPFIPPAPGEQGEERAGLLRNLSLRRIDRRLLILAALAVVAVVIAAIVLAGGGGSEEAATGPQTTSFEAGPEPLGVAVGEGLAWSANRGDGSVWGLDPDQPEARPINLESDAESVRAVGVGFESIWALDREGARVLRFDPRDPNAEPISIPVGVEPADVVADEEGGSVWVANEGGSTVMRISPETNEVNATVEVAEGPEALAVGGDAIWVASGRGRAVSRLDPSSAQLDATIEDVGERPAEIVANERVVWVGDALDDRLRRIGVESLEISGQPIEVDARPQGLTLGAGTLWVAVGEADAVLPLNPRDGGSQGGPVAVGADPADLAYGSGAVWSADFGSDSLTRIEP